MNLVFKIILVMLSIYIFFVLWINYLIHKRYNNQKKNIGNLKINNRKK